MIVYKSLRGGISTVKQFDWNPYIPVDDKPGPWLTPVANPSLCIRGYHGWLTLDRAKADYTTFSKGSLQVFEMELVGDITNDNEKAVGSLARLIKQVWPTPPIEWQKKLDAATTVMARLAVYREAERALHTSGVSPYGSPFSYNPVAPCFHNIGDNCGSMNQPVWHEELEERLEIKSKYPNFSREVILIIWLLRKGMPLE